MSAGVGADRPPLEPGLAVLLRPGVRRVLADNPSVMTGPGTNTYLVGEEEVAVIDPGPRDPEHLDAIVAAAGSGRVRWILLTHTHADHWPGAPALAARTGAQILGYEDRDGLVCDRHLRDGDEVGAPGSELRAVHTPGHAGNHLCFLLEGEGLLFTGDHVMDGSTVVISPPDGDMAAYLASLERLLAWEPPISAIAPAHGHLIGDPGDRLRAHLDHRLAREAQVLRALASHGAAGAGSAELVAEIYTEVAEVLHPVARRSVWAHLRKLEDEGRVVGEDRDGESARWRTC